MSGLRYDNFFLIFRLSVNSVLFKSIFDSVVSYKDFFQLLFSTKSGVNLPPSLDFSYTAQGFFGCKVKANN